MESDPLKVLILDAGAFISQAKFDQFGPDVKYVTLSAVVQQELKDETARQVHSNFPFPIETRIPSAEAIKAIADFSKKTGDFPSLSSVDLQVLALCYMYERERNGLKRIREEPPKNELFLKLRTKPMSLLVRRPPLPLPLLPWSL